MSEKFRLDHKIHFRNTFYTKCINVIIDSIGPSIILRSIVTAFWKKEKITVLPHLLYSLDLALCDFLMFPKLK